MQPVTHKRLRIRWFWIAPTAVYAASVWKEDGEAGLPPATLWTTEVAPALADHVAAEFEEYMRTWIRATQGVSQVDQWWGNAVNALRRAGTRSSEEIDAVGMARGRVTLVAEARWRRGPMDVGYLREVETCKLRALRQSKLKVASAAHLAGVPGRLQPGAAGGGGRT